MTMNQELRQAAVLARAALEKSVDNFPANTQHRAALSALSAVLEKQDSSHLAAPTLQARSGSGVPARPTLPGEDERARFEAWFAANKHRFGMDEGEHGGPAWSAWIERAALAASPLPQEGRTANAKDAARYRWLRDMSVPPHNFYISVPTEFDGTRYSAAEVDAYIDAAIAGTQGEQKP